MKASSFATMDTDLVRIGPNSYDNTILLTVHLKHSHLWSAMLSCAMLEIFVLLKIPLRMSPAMPSLSKTGTHLGQLWLNSHTLFDILQQLTLDALEEVDIGILSHFLDIDSLNDLFVVEKYPAIPLRQLLANECNVVTMCAVLVEDSAWLLPVMHGITAGIVDLTYPA